MVVPTRKRNRPPPIAVFVMASLFCASSSSQSKALPDAEITAAIESKLRLDPGVDPNAVMVQMEEGIATLSGFVPHLLAKDRAVSLARGVKGVRAVVDNMSVQAVSRGDAEIEAAIRRAFERDTAVDERKVSAAVENGVAVLGGSVNSFVKKGSAADAAKSVKGLRGLKNDIQVNYRVERSDRDIQADARRALGDDVWLADDQLTANVAGGKVTLTGTVDSADEAFRAYTKAWVAGATSVDAENLRVDLGSENGQVRRRALNKSDKELKRAVEAALRQDPRVYGAGVAVHVATGAVTLTGRVESLRARTAAEEDARNTVGVRKVNNHLDVRLSSPPLGTPLGETIRASLEWDPYLDGENVSVTVEGGTATLSGLVDTAFQKQRAEAVASWARGIGRIENRIEVEVTPEEKSDRAITEEIERQLAWSPFVDAGQVTVQVTNGVALLDGIVESWAERAAVIEAALAGGAREIIAETLRVRSDFGRAG